MKGLIPGYVCRQCYGNPNTYPLKKLDHRGSNALQTGGIGYLLLPASLPDFRSELYNQWWCKGSSPLLPTTRTHYRCLTSYEREDSLACRQMWLEVILLTVYYCSIWRAHPHGLRPTWYNQAGRPRYNPSIRSVPRRLRYTPYTDKRVTYTVITLANPVTSQIGSFAGCWLAEDYRPAAYIPVNHYVTWDQLLGISIATKWISGTHCSCLKVYTYQLCIHLVRLEFLWRNFKLHPKLTKHLLFFPTHSHHDHYEIHFSAHLGSNDKSSAYS